MPHCALPFIAWHTAPSLSGQTYRAAAHSVVLLFGEIERGETPRQVLPHPKDPTRERVEQRVIINFRHARGFRRLLATRAVTDQPPQAVTVGRAAPIRWCEKWPATLSEWLRCRWWIFPIRTCEEGELVLAEGSTTDRLLFLIQGAVDVTKNGWHIARFAKPGVVFGDMAALRDQSHSADVIAIQKSDFFVVKDAAFFLRTEPLISLYVAVVQSGRLDAANRNLMAARSQFAATDQRGRRFVAALDGIEATLYAAAT